MLFNFNLFFCDAIGQQKSGLVQMKERHPRMKDCLQEDDIEKLHRIEKITHSVILTVANEYSFYLSCRYARVQWLMNHGDVATLLILWGRRPSVLQFIFFQHLVRTFKN